MDGFKQRIIGAIVLVSLAVIFIPMIFEDPHQEKTTKVLPIPAQPEVPAFTIELPKPPERGVSQPGTEWADSAQRLRTVAEYRAGHKAAEELADADAASTQSRQEATFSDTTSAVLGSEKSGNKGTGSGNADGSNAARPAFAALDTPATAGSGSANTEAAATEPNRPAAVSVRSEPDSLAEKAWAVQIGTFRNRPSALKIRDELRASGTPSYTSDIVSGDVAMSRVFAGPTESKESAQQLKQKIDERYQLQSLIVTYSAP